MTQQNQTVPAVLIVGARMKRWYRSWTLWVNFITLGLALFEANLHFLQPLLPVNVWHALAFGLPVVNGLLRFKTVDGLVLPKRQSTSAAGGGDGGEL